MAEPFSRRNRFGEYPKSDTVLAENSIIVGGQKYFAFAPVIPSTPTIVNVTISDDLWNAVATGLTNVLTWRLSERSGDLFDYAYVAAPTAFSTAFGAVSANTSITDIYVKRQTGNTLTLQLEYWSF